MKWFQYATTLAAFTFGAVMAQLVIFDHAYEKALALAIVFAVGFVGGMGAHANSVDVAQKRAAGRR